MGTTGVTARRSNSQNNTISNASIRGGYFSHFGIIGANPLGRFGVFRGNNNNPPSGNNNNNNPLLPFLLSGFGGGLGRSFNSLSGENARGLDPNVTALVNALAGANLGINHIERESNHVKLTEFGETEAEDLNE